MMTSAHSLDDELTSTDLLCTADSEIPPPPPCTEKCNKDELGSSENSIPSFSCWGQTLTDSTLPDPSSVQRQKESYLSLLETQLQQGLEALNVQLQQHRDSIRTQADQQRKAFELQLEMEVDCCNSRFSLNLAFSDISNGLYLNNYSNT